MKFVINGVEIETTSPEETNQVLDMIHPPAPVVPEVTPVERARRALAQGTGMGSTAYAEMSADYAVNPPAAEELIGIKVNVPIQDRPKVYVTPNGKKIIDLLVDHPEGLKTGTIAAHLQIRSSLASQWTTSLCGCSSIASAHPIVECRKGTRTYRLTDYARSANIMVEANPSRMRKSLGLE